MREYVRSAKEPSVSRCLLITAPSDSGQRELTRLRAQISSFTAHVRPANTMFAIYFAHRDLRILLDTRLSKLSQRHLPNPAIPISASVKFQSSRCLEAGSKNTSRHDLQLVLWYHRTYMELLGRALSRGVDVQGDRPYICQSNAAVGGILR